MNKVEELAEVRRSVERKYGAGKPWDVGGSPEPLTDYKDVSFEIRIYFIRSGNVCANVDKAYLNTRNTMDINNNCTG